MTRRSRIAFGCIVGMSGLWLWAEPVFAKETASCKDPVQVELTGTFCAELKPPEVSCRAWADVEGGLAQENLNTVQQAADLFSWQQFLALSWPAGKVRGTPDPTASFSDTG
ncbi:MAG: hypothetical protein KDD11_17990, partial [Acidobacteria bacterium]|nr:hypothetical protein [Acidobacteriota bacterium]